MYARMSKISSCVDWLLIQFNGRGNLFEWEKPFFDQRTIFVHSRPHNLKVSQAEGDRNLPFPSKWQQNTHTPFHKHSIANKFKYCKISTLKLSIYWVVCKLSSLYLVFILFMIRWLEFSHAISPVWCSYCHKNTESNFNASYNLRMIVINCVPMTFLIFWQLTWQPSSIFLLQNISH